MSKLNNLIDKINKLKKEKDALIISHLYQRPEIQDISDIVGDSYFLSKKVLECDKNMIIFCGVSFMAESAKILSPNKRIFLPAKEARCVMADMALTDRVLSLKKNYPNAKVVSYINTNMEIKALSDVCVTSSSAMNVIKNLKEEEIIFLPDRNLGEYISENFKDKKFILYPGFCPVHEKINALDILDLMNTYPSYEVIVHPECKKEVRDLANFVGSTSELITYTKNSSKNGFIVVTEEGVLHQMKKHSPNKEFIFPKDKMICKNMKMTTLEDVYSCLLNETNEITVDEVLRKKAFTALENMHLLGDN